MNIKKFLIYLWPILTAPISFLSTWAFFCCIYGRVYMFIHVLNAYGEFIYPRVFPVYTTLLVICHLLACFLWLWRPRRMTFALTLFTGCVLLGGPMIVILAFRSFRHYG